MILGLSKNPNIAHILQQTHTIQSQQVDSTVHEVQMPSIKPNINSTVRVHSLGVYFRQDLVQFGSIEVGSLTRVKIELCNATDHEVRILILISCFCFT